MSADFWNCDCAAGKSAVCRSTASRIAPFNTEYSGHSYNTKLIYRRCSGAGEGVSMFSTSWQRRKTNFKDKKHLNNFSECGKFYQADYDDLAAGAESGNSWRPSI